jgi:S-adenosylmethionine:tRNA ribosyltransferase-isomerase
MGHPGLLVDPGLVRHATEPPEARGLRRDRVKLMVSHGDGRIEHLRFDDLPRLLRRNDLLIVNASATVKASLPARRSFGAPLELHLSTQLPGDLWTVEVRESTSEGSRPLRLALAGEVLELPDGGRATLLAPYPFAGDLFTSSRLWSAALELPIGLESFLERHGSPIRYGYVARNWPISYYQTMFATQPGSAEMPSAARPFTEAVVQQLRDVGVNIAPVVLHTGVSSLDDHEPPYEERFHVPRATAEVVNETRRTGGRVIAVGTTSVRAIETTTDELGVTHPGQGWTDLVIGTDVPVRAVDGLLTGLHEPRASHLSLIRAIMQRQKAEGKRPKETGESGDHLERAYGDALEREYLWHEFGDSHLFLPL